MRQLGRFGLSRGSRNGHGERARLLLCKVNQNSLHSEGFKAISLNISIPNPKVHGTFTFGVRAKHGRSTSQGSSRPTCATPFCSDHQLGTLLDGACDDIVADVRGL